MSLCVCVCVCVCTSMGFCLLRASWSLHNSVHVKLLIHYNSTCSRRKCLTFDSIYRCMNHSNQRITRLPQFFPMPTTIIILKEFDSFYQLCILCFITVSVNINPFPSLQEKGKKCTFGNVNLAMELWQ